jgi:hypothetical protein
MRSWSVTVEAFGHVSVKNIEAPTRREAEEKALSRIGFKVEAHEKGAKLVHLDNYSRKVV